MSEGYRVMFWGIFFITFHINLGPISILPAFIGYLIVSRGIDRLQGEFASPFFRKARLVSNGLTILGVISFLLVWFPQSESIMMSYYPLSFSILELFLVYYVLEGSMERMLACGDGRQVDSYRSEQRSYLIFMTIYIVGMCLAITIAEEISTTLMILLGLFLRFWFLAMLGRLKRSAMDVGSA